MELGNNVLVGCEKALVQHGENKSNKHDASVSCPLRPADFMQLDRFCMVLQLFIRFLSERGVLQSVHIQFSSIWSKTSAINDECTVVFVVGVMVQFFSCFFFLVFWPREKQKRHELLKLQTGNEVIDKRHDCIFDTLPLPHG